MTLDAGARDREIVIQTAPVVQSDSGETSFDWANAEEMTLWAQWLPAGTREAWQAQQRLASYVDGVFHIHDISPRPTPENTRILYDGRLFDVKPYIEIEERGEGLEIPVIARGE